MKTTELRGARKKLREDILNLITDFEVETALLVNKATVTTKIETTGAVVHGVALDIRLFGG